jgi:uncharacterized protein YjbJ (UPF0337 family)
MALSINVDSEWQETTMNQDQAKSRVEEIDGNEKDVVGLPSGNEKLRQKYAIKNAISKIRAKSGDQQIDVKQLSIRAARQLF